MTKPCLRVFSQGRTTHQWAAELRTYFRDKCILAGDGDTFSIALPPRTPN